MPEHIVLETLTYHRFFAFLLFCPPLLAILFLFYSQHFPYLIRRIKLLTPVYGFLITTNIFIGIILSVLLQFLSVSAMWMIFVSLWLVIGEVKRYKKQRVIASYDTELQKAFIAWAKKKYALDLLALLSVFIWVIM